MDLAKLMRQGGGVIRRARARGLGVPSAAIDHAVATGSLTLVRRRWLAMQDADPALVAAARAGVVISCVSAARRLGLWVLEQDYPHVAARSHAGRVRCPQWRVHWGRPVVGRSPDALIDPIENVLCYVSDCQPAETALAVWESALNQGLVDKQSLETLPWSASARNLLNVASPFSDSGLETLVLARLRWLKIRLIPQAWVCGRRVDILVGERLVLQLDGGHHVDAQRSQDIAHDCELVLRGYTVIRISYHQVVHDWPAVQERIMRAVAQGKHRVQANRA